MSEFILRLININRGQELLAGLLTVDELSLGYGTGVQYTVPVKSHR